MKAIGIGCYWFASKRNPNGESDEFSISEFIGQLRPALERVDSVSNIEIDLDDRFAGGSPLRFADKEENLFPLFSAGSISFDIFMPARLQEKYAFELAVGHGIENFHVDIKYCYDMPVAFVSFDVPEDVHNWRELSPSFPVAFIRDHLKAKLSLDTEIEFQSIGPSPLHADIFVKNTSRQISEPEAEDVSRGTEGYKTLVFTICGSEQEILRIFEAHYDGTLATFYRVVVFRNDLLALRNGIIETTQSLFQSRSKNPVEAIRRYARSGKIIDSAFKLVLDERLCRVYLSEFVEERRGQTLQEKNIFHPLVMREMTDISQMPLEDVKEILKMLEERRQQYFGNFSTVISSIAGGLIGAVIGAAMSFGLGYYASNQHSVAQAAKAATNSPEGAHQKHPEPKP